MALADRLFQRNITAWRIIGPISNRAPADEMRNQIPSSYKKPNVATVENSH